MTSRNVFISYSNQDKSKVDTLIRALDNERINYSTDQQIRAGDKWEQTIESALHRASVFLFFISPHFLESHWAMFEIGLALSRAKEQGVTIIPVLLHPTQLPEYIRGFQSIDASSLKPSEFAHRIKQIVQSK
jgi:hypothetical protein